MVAYMRENSGAGSRTSVVIFDAQGRATVETCAPVQVWVAQESRARDLSRGTKESNKHKQLLGIVLRTGWGSSLFMCCPSLGPKGKHINKIPTKPQAKCWGSPGQSRDNESRDSPVNNLLMCFLVHWLSPAL